MPAYFQWLFIVLFSGLYWMVPIAALVILRMSARRTDQRLRDLQDQVAALRDAIDDNRRRLR